MPFTRVTFADVPLAQASHKSNPRGSMGSIAYGRIFYVISVEAKNGSDGEQSGSSTVIQKRSNDAVHQSDDDGSFKKCLYSEYHLKDGLLFILLSY